MADSAEVKTWTIEPPSTAVQQTIERLARAPDVAQIAIMPDVHLAAGVSNGVVVATRRLIYPVAVGGDIGCGFATVAFDGAAGPLRRRAAAATVLEHLPRAVPVMRHKRRDGLPKLVDAIDASGLSHAKLAQTAAAAGRLELGTLGRGNHFLEAQEDEEGRLWLMVHSGSRAMGPAILAHHLGSATSAGGGLAWLDADNEAGQAYLRDATWARAYAAESRRKMLLAAAEVLADVLAIAPDWSTLLNTDHNHVERERHGADDFWVHRKGANHAGDGAANLIPGSIATHSFHVVGRAEPAALRSSSHGAGRRLSRGAARAQIKRKDLERQLADVWVDPQAIKRLVDEAPTAYKDIYAVMRAQRDLVRIERRLRPVLCYKGI